MWYLKNNILMREAGADGGAGGSSFTAEDSFSDVDDFDLSGLAGKANQDKQGEEVENKTPVEKKVTPKAEKDGLDKNGNKVNIPDDDKDEEISDDIKKEATEKNLKPEDLKKQKDAEVKAEEEKEKANEKLLTDLETKLKKEGKSKDDIEKALEEKRQEIFDTEIDNEINPFKDYVPAKEPEKATEKIDFNSIAKEAGIELEEGVELKTKEEYVAAVKKSIDKAKQTLDLSAFPPEARMIIENLKKNNNLLLTDFYRNDVIRGIDGFLSLPEDRKIKSVLAEDGKKLGHKDQDLVDYVNEKFTEMTDIDIAAKVKEINGQASALKTKEYNKIINEKNKFLEENTKREIERVNSEKKVLIDKLKETKEFMGFPINETILNSMVKEIESGTFQNFLDENAAEAKINAYIHTKLGKQFKEAYAKLLKISKSEAYKKGLETLTKQKHNIRTAPGTYNSNKRTSKDLSFSSAMFEEE